MNFTLISSFLHAFEKWLLTRLFLTRHSEKIYFKFLLFQAHLFESDLIKISGNFGEFIVGYWWDWWSNWSHIYSMNIFHHWFVHVIVESILEHYFEDLSEEGLTVWCLFISLCFYILLWLTDFIQTQIIILMVLCHLQ